MRALAATMLVGLLSGCAPTRDASTSGESSHTSDGAEVAPGSRIGDLPRIVSLIPSVTELVVELDARHALVARTDFDRQPELSGLPSVGGGLDPNLEALVGVGAEVVLLAATRDASALGQRIEALGIRVQSVEIQTIDDMYATLGELGELLDREPKADSLVRSISHDLDEIGRRVAGRERVPVFYVVWSDPPMTTGGGTFVDEVIRIAGGRNVFEDAPLQWPTVGFESIVDRRPAVVLWPRGDGAEADVERLRTVPGWRDVEAVQEGRVELVDADTFNRPGPRVVQAALRLARVLHPSVW
jgi:iron complex transport system substrate-binding protein